MKFSFKQLINGKLTAARDVTFPVDGGVRITESFPDCV